jgi:hypothetical protein
MAISEARAKIIARIEAKILDKINDMKTNGGTFLQQTPTVTVSGLPVAIRIGGLGGLSSLGGALSSITSVVQAAGDIASLVQNPMALVQSAVGDAISGVSSQISAAAGQLTGGQLSQLNGIVSNFNTALSTFETHTSCLSGLASGITDAIPDFNKIVDLGNTITGLGSDSRDAFIQNTASALYSDTKLTDIKDTLSSTVQSKLELIKRQDANTAAGQTAISLYVTEIATLLNNQKNTISDIVTTDTHNFNEAANNVTASTSVIDLAEQFADTTSMQYVLLNRVGKESTISAFNTAITDSTIS